MRPIDVQNIGEELAIKWENGSETFIGWKQLRMACPCAGCLGEKDIMGNLYKGPEKPLVAESCQLKRIELVGGYALQPVWGDGHSAGLYSFEYLLKVAGTQKSCC